MHNMIVDVEMISGETHENIRIVLADMIRHSDIARRHKWGGLQDDPIRAMAFMSYSAMVRLGKYDGNKGFDDFTQEVAMVHHHDTEEVDPTPAVTPYI